MKLSKCNRVEGKFVYFYEQEKVEQCLHMELEYQVVGERFEKE